MKSWKEQEFDHYLTQENEEIKTISVVVRSKNQIVGYAAWTRVQPTNEG